MAITCFYFHSDKCITYTKSYSIFKEENKLGFRKGRGTDDGLFTIRQIIEKRREFRKDVAFGFVDLEKAFDTVPRELAFAVMRWMEVGETEVRIVEEMYKETTAAVRAERETSEQFGVAVGLRQGSALSPLLFIMVMNLISAKVSEQEELKKLLYADDLVVVADNKEDLHKTLQEWSNTFRKHGIRMNLDKREVMWIGEQEVDLHVVVDRKAIKQVNTNYTWAAQCVRMKEVVRKYRGECKLEQQRGGEWKALCGTETEETTKRKSVGSLRGTSLYIRVGNTGTDRETGGEDSRKQLGLKNMQSNPRR